MRYPLRCSDCEIVVATTEEASLPASGFTLYCQDCANARAIVAAIFQGKYAELDALNAIYKDFIWYKGQNHSFVNWLDLQYRLWRQNCVDI